MVEQHQRGLIALFVPPPASFSFCLASRQHGCNLQTQLVAPAQPPVRFVRRWDRLTGGRSDSVPTKGRRHRILQAKWPVLRIVMRLPRGCCTKSNRYRISGPFFRWGVPECCLVHSFPMCLRGWETIGRRQRSTVYWIHRMPPGSNLSSWDWKKPPNAWRSTASTVDFGLDSRSDWRNSPFTPLIKCCCTLCWRLLCRASAIAT